MKLTNNGQHRGKDTWRLYVWEAPLYISGRDTDKMGREPYALNVALKQYHMHMFCILIHGKISHYLQKCEIKLCFSKLCCYLYCISLL